MLESLMVFPNDNHFFNLPQHFDDGMAKLMQQQEQIETFIASASASPVQDYLLAPVPSQPSQSALNHRPQAQPQSQPHLSPSYPSHPLDQNAMAFSNTMPQLIPSAPASPSYPIIKTESSEEHHFQRLRQHQSYQQQQQPQQQQQVDFLMYPSFEMQGQQSATASPTQPQHVVASQISNSLAMTAAPATQPRLAPAHSDVELFHQRQQHQQQQQRHAQQLRLQHQHQQQQRMMEQQQQFSQPSFSQSANTTNMMIPVTTTTLSAMLDAVCSAPGSAMPMVQPVENEHFVPATIATSMPLFESTHDSFQSQSGYIPKTHPASPTARQRADHETVRNTSPTLLDTIPSPTMPVAIVPNMSASSSPAPAIAAPVSSPSISTSQSSSRISTSSRLDKVKPSRTTRITKSSSSSTSTLPTDTLPSTTTTTATTAAMARAAKAASTRAAKRAATTASPVTTEVTTATPITAVAASAPAAPIVYQHLPGSHGNVTHPRRAAQNRAAQRTFRNRRKAYIKDLESKVQQLDSTKAQNEQLVSENQRLLQHAQQLEQMLAEAGFRLQPGMTSLTEMDLSLTFQLSRKDENEKNASENDREDADPKSSSSSEEQREQEHRPLTEQRKKQDGFK
ncbi:hypothetical protein BGW42_008394 [Actinomortierella wolfii]|nr:hypothetical protein BGW42_008394 [Actinomortierella wolfii]